MARSFPAAFSTLITGRSTSLRLLFIIKLPTSGTPVRYWSTSDYTHSYGGAQTGTYSGVILDPGSFKQGDNPDTLEARVGKWDVILSNANGAISDLFDGADFVSAGVDFKDTEIVVTAPELLEDAFTTGQLDSIYSTDDYDTLRQGLDSDHALFVGWVKDIPHYSDRKMTLSLTDAGGKWMDSFGTVITDTNYARAAPSAKGLILPYPIGSVSQLRFLPTVSGRRTTLTSDTPAPPELGSLGYSEWTVDDDISAWDRDGVALVIPAGARTDASTDAVVPIPAANSPFVIQWENRETNKLLGVSWTTLSGSVGPVPAGSVILEIPNDGLFRWNADESLSTDTATVSNPRFNGVPPLDSALITLVNGSSGTKPEIRVPAFLNTRTDEMEAFPLRAAGYLRASSGTFDAAGDLPNIRDVLLRQSTRRTEWSLPSSTSAILLLEFPSLAYVDALAGEVILKSMDVLHVLQQIEMRSLEASYPETDSSGIIRLGVKGPVVDERKGRSAAAQGGFGLRSSAKATSGKSFNKASPANTGKIARETFDLYNNPANIGAAQRSQIKQEISFTPTGGTPKYLFYDAAIDLVVKMPRYSKQTEILSSASMPTDLDVKAGTYTTTFSFPSDAFDALRTAEVAELIIDFQYILDAPSGIGKLWEDMHIKLGTGSGETILWDIHGADMRGWQIRDGGYVEDANQFFYDDVVHIQLPIRPELLQRLGTDIHIEILNYSTVAGSTSETVRFNKVGWRFHTGPKYSGGMFEATGAVQSLGEFVGGNVTADIACTTTNPSTVIEQLATDALSLGAWEVDSAGSFASAATRFTALGYAFGGAFTERITNIQALYQLAMECRAILSRDGGQLRLSIREDSADTAAAVATLVRADYVADPGQVEISFKKDSFALTTNIVRALFDRDYSLPMNDEAYRQLSVQGSGDIERAQSFRFDFISAVAMMADVAAFYSTRHGGRGRLIYWPARLEFLGALPTDIYSVNWQDGDGTTFDGLDGTGKFEVVFVDPIYSKRGGVPKVALTLREVI